LFSKKWYQSCGAKPVWDVCAAKPLWEISQKKHVCGAKPRAVERRTGNVSNKHVNLVFPKNGVTVLLNLPHPLYIRLKQFTPYIYIYLFISLFIYSFIYINRYPETSAPSLFGEGLKHACPGCQTLFPKK
jgi:hypothetical protein